MTGFARVRRSFGDGEIVLSLKAVNHRALDLHFYAPAAVDPFEASLRAQVKARVARGHLDVRISLPRSAGDGALRVNRAMLASYLELFTTARTELGLDCPPDLNAALRIPGMLEESAAPETDAALGAALAETMDAALDELNAFREREGAAVADAIRAHNAEVVAVAQKVGELRGAAQEWFRSRLRDRLAELLDSSSVDPQRLVQEAAILADRSDIAEEISRLSIHAAQLGNLLDRGGETGKKLDFLLQEMNRETNTMLSKTNGIGEAGLGITDLALRAKSAIEKIRELSLNLE
jgi:uncharacterized protein (TIGR00255 family)